VYAPRGHDLLAAGALPSEEHPPTPHGNEPAPGLEPGTARLQGGCNPPHPAPTSDSGYTAAPTGCLKPHRLTPFRVTNDVTPPLGAVGSVDARPNSGSGCDDGDVGAAGRSANTASASIQVSRSGYSVARRVVRIRSTGRSAVPIDVSKWAFTACRTARCSAPVVGRNLVLGASPPWHCRPRLVGQSPLAIAGVNPPAACISAAASAWECRCGGQSRAAGQQVPLGKGGVDLVSIAHRPVHSPGATTSPVGALRREASPEIHQSRAAWLFTVSGSMPRASAV
jgi:hypothetical protein